MSEAQTVPVKQKCLAYRWDVYCSADILLWLSNCSQGAESNATAIHLLPCFLQGHRNWSRSEACPTSSPKSSDARLPDSCPWGHASSCCKNADEGQLKKTESAQQADTPRIPDTQQARSRNPQVPCCHSAQEKHQGKGMAEALPGAGTSRSAPGNIEPEVSRIRYPLGVKHMLTRAAGLVPAPSMAEPWLLLSVEVLKKRWGTYESLDIHWNVCSSSRLWDNCVYTFEWICIGQGGE